MDARVVVVVHMFVVVKTNTGEGFTMVRSRKTIRPLLSVGNDLGKN